MSKRKRDADGKNSLCPLEIERTRIEIPNIEIVHPWNDQVLGQKVTSRLSKIIKKICKLDEKDSECVEFYELARAKKTPDVANPLLVIVHPGDALHNTNLINDRLESKRITDYLNKCQKGMQYQIRRRIDRGWEIVVLHRGSSSQLTLEKPWINKEYADAIAEANKIGEVLFGDDLDCAATWMQNNLCVSQRSEIFVVGAYGDERDGCARHIMELLKTKGAPNVKLSGHSPLAAIEYGKYNEKTKIAY